MTPLANPLSSTAAVKALAARLERCPQIASLNDEDHNEAWTLAQSLSDLAASSAAYLKVLPTLVDERLEGNELVQRLIDVVNELQHMLYHLEDPRFFRQLLEPLRQDWEKARTPGATPTS
jgi:hypothetical protein